VRLTTLPKAAKETGFPYAELLKLTKSGRIPVLAIENRRSSLIDIDDLYAFIESAKSGAKDGTKDEEEPLQTAPNKKSRERSTVPNSSVKYQWMQKFTRKRKACS
jgi:hypothetical protein